MNTEDKVWYLMIKFYLEEKLQKQKASHVHPQDDIAAIDKDYISWQFSDIMNIKAWKSCHLFLKRRYLGGLAPTALASYPGSGNTYLRDLVEHITGITTQDERDSVKGGIKPGREILIKSHHRKYHFYLNPFITDSWEWRAKDIEYFNGEGVLLIRNPFHAIRSSWNHIYGEGKDFNIQSAKFQQFAHHEADMWLEIIQDWMLMGTNVHVVFYENLVKDWKKELRLLMKFLNLKINEERVECTDWMKLESFKRKKVQLKSSPYSSSVEKKILKNILYIKELLEGFGISMPTYLPY